MNKPWHNPNKQQVFTPALSNRPTGPRWGESKVSHVKQGVSGALRAKNLRLLLEAAKAPEDLAALAEVPLERIQNMAEGALCSDETAYHIEQELSLPTGWLDQINAVVPPEIVAVLKAPETKTRDADPPFYPASLPSAPTPQPGAYAAPLPVEALRTAPSVSAKIAKPSAKTGNLPVGWAPDVSTTAIGLAMVTALSNLEVPARDTELPLMEQPAEVPKLLEPATAGLPEASALTKFEAKPQHTLALFTSLPSTSSSTSLPTTSTSLSSQLKGFTMTATDLRRQNLGVLLEGKGAKSALARVLGLSPASITGMLNGAKALDKVYCSTIAKALKLPDNWFETERTAADVTLAIQKKLSPLVRGAPVEALTQTLSEPSAAPSVAASPVEPAAHAKAPPPAVPVATVPASTAPVATVPRVAAPVEPPVVPPLIEPPRMPQSWPDPASKASKVQRLLGAASTAPAAPLSAAPSPAVVAQVLVPTVTPVEATAVAVPSVAVSGVPAAQTAAIRVGDVLPTSVVGLVDTSELSPITEALLKTLVQKARQGVLSDDRAFELLGSIRAL